MAEPIALGRSVARSWPSGGGLRVAIHAADFGIDDKDQIALVGPSGSGKTTLLHLLAGLDDPTTGEITWPALGPKQTLRPRLVSVAFQGAALLPALTVIENVALPLLLMGGREVDSLEAASALLERFDVGEPASNFPDQLSGGQLQRAGLARALVTKPRLVLIDEPTGQQDRETAARLLDALLGHLTETGAAAIMATHDEAVASRFPRRWSLGGGHLTTDTISLCSA